MREYVTNGGDRKKAARLAGYSDPRTEGYRLLNTQKVRKAIKHEQERVITCEGRSRALAAMLGLHFILARPATIPRARIAETE